MVTTLSKTPLVKKGDFITSPDITQIFGEVIGSWSIDIINKINSKSSFQIIDLGGGRGTLLKDIKRISKDNKISFGFLEINKNLMIVQKKFFLMQNIIKKFQIYLMHQQYLLEMNF